MVIGRVAHAQDVSTDLVTDATVFMIYGGRDPNMEVGEMATAVPPSQVARLTQIQVRGEAHHKKKHP